MSKSRRDASSRVAAAPQKSDGQADARNPWTEPVYGRLERLTERMLRRFAVVRSNDEAKDVLNSAVVRLLKASYKEQPLPEEQFIALAVAGIRCELLNLANKYRGRSWRFTHAANPSQPGKKSRTEWDIEEPAEIARHLDDWTEFHESVDHLPLVEREVVSLLFYHGWKQEEVGDLFQMSVRTIRQRWKSGMRKVQFAAGQD
jgi:RNA polymerase sigma factor (sigma-70 family)